MKRLILMIMLVEFIMSVMLFAQESNVKGRIDPMSFPRVGVAGIRDGEKPVEVKREETVVCENGLFKRIRNDFVFLNPNARVMGGEFVFPIPDDAFVCGYSLEVCGEMIPGVVCEKAKARIAFENEVRKGVDPGIVEQVKGNVWRTGIFPLNPGIARRATVDYIVPVREPKVNEVWEKDGDDVFVGRVRMEKAKRVSVIEKVRAFDKGTILWDASLSAGAHSSEWMKMISMLPTKGEWVLVAFRHVAGEKKAFTDREALLKEISSIVYDGGTDLKEAFAGLEGDVLFFSDETDTLGKEAFHDYEMKKGVVIASRKDVPFRKIDIEKVSSVPNGINPVESRLLATVRAFERMKDLAALADSRKEEFLALGRKYGVAGEGMSLIVLENLQQWIDNKIEPPKELKIHDDWVKEMAKSDDEISKKKRKAAHEQQLLKYWEERVRWWNEPKPKKNKPKSGLFDSQRNESAVTSRAILVEEEKAGEDVILLESAPVATEAMRGGRIPPLAKSKSLDQKRDDGEGGFVPATLELAAWDPKTPYLNELAKSKKALAYETYLRERKSHEKSPAFYLDCAGWFFKNGETNLGLRIITNLSEFKLEDAALWRTMGWRLREAGLLEFSCKVFEKVLAMRPEEGQSLRDLALVKTEWGKALFACGDKIRAKKVLEQAMKLFADAAFNLHERRSLRIGNDFQVSVIALEELNGLLTWCESQSWDEQPVVPEFDSAYRRDMPMDLRIVMSWDSDMTDIDIHVLEPDGEEAFYGNRRTSEGGFVSEDVTTGYGPEEYLRKHAGRGGYKIISHYFASHQLKLTGPAVVTATVYTNWGRKGEEMKVLSLRLEKQKDKHDIGKITF